MHAKAGLIVGLALLAGVVAGFLLTGGSPFPAESSGLSKNAIFVSSNEDLRSQFENKKPWHAGWKDLLPENEASLIKQYQPDKTKPMNEQVFTSIQASFDADYQATLTSTNTVKTLHNRAVTINGFIVPLDVNDQREILSFFLVPYFGACIHFPPPAPNQMIYVRSPEGFTMDGSSDAYTISGILQVAMFEDPVGTSAYLMDAVSIQPFSGKPDDVRDHEFQTY